MSLEIAKNLQATIDKRPLVHFITNYVTANDCANICLAVNGSPIMADAIEEVAQITEAAASLVINIGTLNAKTVQSMIVAGETANQNNIPVILDPAGVGASNFRSEMVILLLSTIKFDVIRGNLSEINYLVNQKTKIKGVDAVGGFENDQRQKIIVECAKKYNCLVVCTGKIDLISNGNQMVSIDNGNSIMAEITGTGCMSTALIGTFCAASDDLFTAAVTGILVIDIAGELAYLEEKNQGLGSFHTALIDHVSNINFSTLELRAKINETKY